MYEVKKNGKVFTSKSVGTWPSSYRKNNLLGRGLTKVEKHCSKAWVATVRLLGLRVRIPPEAWMFVCCERCVLSDRGLCDGLITRPEESYRLCGV